MAAVHAIAVHAELGLDDLVPRVGGRQQVLPPVTDPLDRPAQATGHDAGRDFLGIERRFGAEAAAHVGRDHADPVLRHVE
jgi:hypothetical protein